MRRGQALARLPSAVPLRLSCVAQERIGVAIAARACPARTLRQTRILALPGAPTAWPWSSAPLRAVDAASVPLLRKAASA